MAYYRRRRNPFAHNIGSRSPVYTSPATDQKRRSKCKGCGQFIEKGDPYIKVKLRRQYRTALCTCGRKKIGTKRYHTQCVPTDLNLAMNYDPAQTSTYVCRACGHTQTAPFGVFCPHCGKDPNARSSGGVAPPPKPKSAKEITLEAVAKFEEALVAQVRQRQKPMTPELEGEFKKFQGIKARILRPSTEGEEQAAVVVGLQRLVKLVLS